MSPGSVALLFEHVTEPAAQKRLAEAVKHEDPAVRAVAARIAFVTASRGLVPGLISALAKEEHVPTAVEQIRALLGMLGRLACAADPFPPTRPRIHPESTIVPPDRKRPARMTYPDAAQRGRIEGTVLLGVRLSYTGCIGVAETLRSADPMLDLAAIRGVFSAAYTPTLLDGQPVETFITYTVNFDLR